MSTPPIRLPSGVRDFLPRAAARRRELAEHVIGVFEAWGYQRVITPVFEHAEVLERGLGAGARAAAIRFVEPGTGEVVALRPDITPQIARLVATRMADVSGPIRLCYEGALYRLGRLAGEPGQREIIQAGIELCDAPAPHGDAEVLAVAAAALAGSGLTEWRIDIGHVAPAAFVLGAAGEARDALVAALARKDRAGVRAAARALPVDVAPLAEQLAHLWGPASATLDRAEALPWPAPVRAAFVELRAVLSAFAELVDDTRAPIPELTLDLGDLRGFDYYTGMRFAAFAAGAGDAVLRGGRYDELLGRYGRARHATGFAIDLETVAEVHAGDPPRVAGLATDDPELARALRCAGLRAVVQRVAPEDWERWLRDSGLDAAVIDGTLLPSGIAARAAIEAALAGDTKPLIALLDISAPTG
jgi:ATP phosphoribosyltransferase regulatory subunit